MKTNLISPKDFKYLQDFYWLSAIHKKSDSHSHTLYEGLKRDLKDSNALLIGESLYKDCPELLEDSELFNVALRIVRTAERPGDN